MWDIYQDTNRRRKNTFYYLFSTMAIYSFILYNPERGYKVPLFEVEVDIFIAMALSPLIISIITSSYLFLSSYTIITFVDFLQVYDKLILSKNKTEIPNFLAFLLLKHRDLTQYFNPYQLARTNSGHWKDRYPKLFFLLMPILNNSLTLIILLFPYLSYFIVIQWLINNHQSYINIETAIPIFAFYSLATLAFIITPILFYFRSKKQRRILKDWQNDYNAKREIFLEELGIEWLLEIPKLWSVLSLIFSAMSYHFDDQASSWIGNTMDFVWKEGKGIQKRGFLKT